MKLKSLLKNDIPTINPNTTGNMSLLIMEEYKTSHLIILSDTEFKGVIDQDSILEMEDMTNEISTVINKSKKISLNINNHICTALKTFSENKISIIPIFNENKYFGYVTISDIIYRIGEPYQLTEIGIITIKNINIDIIINKKDLTRIIKSLQRFNWNIIETYDTSLVDNLDNRFDSFLRYLNT